MIFNFRNIFLSILYCGFQFQLTAQPSTADRPRLVIGIMIDGMQQKHLDLLWNYLDSNGFKKIIEGGANCKNVSYNIVSAGNASDVANVMTGTTPYYNGVAGNKYFLRSNREVQSILQDDNQFGIGTRQKVSAHNLLSSTVLDELMLANQKKSKSFAIGIDAEEAIMMGGHTANSVAWIDEINMKWISTDYYTMGLSKWADETNTGGSFQAYAGRMWEPLFSINTYTNKPGREDKKLGFQYDPKSRINKNSNSNIFKNTPFVNSLVTELALKTMYGEDLGGDNNPDMLMLQYTVRTPNEKTSAMQTAEKEDIYLRLDKEIQDLLQKVDAKVGLNKTLVFMYSNQTDVHSPNELGENRIPAGYFNARRSMALLNTFLMAIYGQERWVDGYYGKNIFLNKQKAEEKKVNIREMQQYVADFMLEFEGIQSAFPSTQILSMGGNANSEIARIRNSTHKNSVGDIIISLLPGWMEVDDKNNPVGESNAIVSYTPLYFYGWQIKPQKINSSYQTIDIAPTLSRILNIPMPNASIGKPIEEIIK